MKNVLFIPQLKNHPMKYALYWWTVIAFFAISFILLDFWEILHKRPSIIFDDDKFIGIRLNTLIPSVVLGFYVVLVLSYTFVKERAHKNKWKKVL